MQQTEQKSIALPPADPLGARFCNWFNHPWHPICSKVPAPGEKAQWFTEVRYPITPRNLWEKYLNPDILLGLRFANEATRYCLLDVDRGSSYHPANDPIAFNSLLAAFEEIGLCRPLVVRSSESQGLHVYFFLSEPLPTFSLACTLQFAAEDEGFKVRGGELEIFPNVKAFSRNKPTDYQGHRLPLQAGSYWLDEDFEPLSNDLERFLDAADLAAANQDLDALKEAIAAAAKRPKTYKPTKSAAVEEWKRDWETIIAQGWTGPGQTNTLLKLMAAYGIVFQELTGEALVDYVVKTATSASGYEQFCRHQYEIRKRAQEWASCTESNEFYIAYCGWPNRKGTYKQTFGDRDGNNVVPFKRPWVNSERAEQAQHRITCAVEALEALGQFPVGVRAREGAIVAEAKKISGVGVARVTLHKHLDLWHPAHYKPEDVLRKKPSIQKDSSNRTTPPLCSTVASPLPESPEPLPALDSSDVSYTPPLMKVGGAEPGGKENPQNSLSLRGTFEFISSTNGCSSISAQVSDNKFSKSIVLEMPGPLEVPPTALAASEVQSAAASVPQVVPLVPVVSVPQAVSAISAASVPVDLKAIGRITRLRVEAKSRAQKVVRQQALNENRLFSREEGERREAIAKFQFFWRSGEPVLQHEATEWAIAHPEDLPEALLSVATEELPPVAVEQVPVAPVVANMLPVAPASEEVLDDLALPQVAQEAPVVPAAEELPLVVGDRVWWDGCPGHCSWLNPFTITAIKGDMAQLDFYSDLIPLFALRRCLS